MEGEAAPLIARLGLQAVDNLKGEEFGLKAFNGQVGNLNVHIALNGICPKHGVDNIGTVISTLNALRTIEQVRPDLLLNAGTAGGFKSRDGEIGDVYFSEGTIVNHDHRIPLPGFQEYGVGFFATLPLNTLPEIMNGKRGVVSTGNSLDITPADAELLNQSSAHIKEMEAAAIARVAELKKIPFIAIKVITDIADEPDNHLVFQANYAVACENLALTLEKLLKYLSGGKNLEEL